MRPFISLCMIVKNEEKVIRRCLESVAHLVDEVIVVDTGSTDNTKEIVADYTTKVFDFEWINDFSAARNYAASKATGEWIVVLDADEYVDKDNFIEFINDIKADKNQVDTYYAKILNFTGSFGESLVQNFHDRIYRNNGEIRYHRKIHEQFKNVSGIPLKSEKSKLLIFHSGYLKNTVTEKNKSERNKELLDNEMGNGDKNAFDYFNLGNEYSSLGNYEKALDSYLQAYKNKKDFRLAWVSTTLIQIVICLINLKRFNDALQVIQDVESIYTNSPEFLYLKGEVFLQKGQFEDAKIVFNEILHNQNKFFHIIFRPDLKDQKPHLRLGEIYLYEKDFKEAVYHYTSVLNINKYNEESINKIILLLNKFHTNDEIMGFLVSNQLINQRNIKLYVKACFDVGNPNLALSLLGNISVENKLLYKVALFKKLCILREGSLIEIDDILRLPVLKQLITSKWINGIDLFLLKKYNSNNKKIYEIMDVLEKDKEYKSLIDIFEKNKEKVNIEENVYIFALNTLISYKHYDLCKDLLINTSLLNDKSMTKVAALLHFYGFKIEAIQLYQKIDWSYYREQDFINIIESLLETNNKVGAIELSKYANIIFEEDFRFYKFIIENAEDTELLSKTIIKAQLQFPKSIYMEKYSI